jgi:hypothetical protein
MHKVLLHYIFLKYAVPPLTWRLNACKSKESREEGRCENKKGSEEKVTATETVGALWD